MPRLTFPARKDGLFVDVLVGLDGATTTAMVAAGQPIAAPLRLRGLIDTGSDITVINEAKLQQLGVPVQLQATTQTVAGNLSVQVYEVSVGITDFGMPNAPELVEPDLPVMGLPPHLKKIDVLIGLDMLQSCRLLLDGPAKQFTLEF